MKRTVMILLLVLLTVGFASCNKKEESEEETGYQIYYISNSETRLETKSYQVEAAGKYEQLKELLICLGTTSGKLEYKAPLAYGFKVLDAQIRRGTAYINVDAAYKELPATTEVLVRAALVNTLTQIEGVDYVNMTVEGRQLYDNAGEAVGRMSADQFVYNDGNEINTYELARVKLYFANESGDKLIAAYREKHYSTNVSMERLIVEEMIEGPSGQVQGIYPTINGNTKILSVTTKDGICYVNLDATFLKVKNNVSIQLAIYSIVNSLVELPTVNKVQILVDGEVPLSFSRAVYERNLDCVTTLEQE